MLSAREVDGGDLDPCVEEIVLFSSRSAANVRKFKADSFVIDEKFNVTLAVKRAAEASTNSGSGGGNLNESQPEAKRMKIEESSTEISNETSVTAAEETRPAETEQKLEESDPAVPQTEVVSSS